MKLDPREARLILRQCDFGALATQSAKLPGYPFVSHAPLALDTAGRPLMLFSRLAEHSRNLEAEPRASLMVSVPGGDAQAQPRLTLLGELRPAEVEPASRERYLRYHPDAATYLGFGDFRFFRLDVVGLRLVGGFARAGWIAPEGWSGRVLGDEDEAALRAGLQAEGPPDWEILGLDWEGLDARSPQGRRRLSWDPQPATVDGLAHCARAALSQFRF